MKPTACAERDAASLARIASARSTTAAADGEPGAAGATSELSAAARSATIGSA